MCVPTLCDACVRGTDAVHGYQNQQPSKHARSCWGWRGGGFGQVCGARLTCSCLLAEPMQAQSKPTCAWGFSGLLFIFIIQWFILRGYEPHFCWHTHTHTRTPHQRSQACRARRACPPHQRSQARRACPPHQRSQAFAYLVTEVARTTWCAEESHAAGRAVILGGVQHACLPLPAGSHVPGVCTHTRAE